MGEEVRGQFPDSCHLLCIGCWLEWGFLVAHALLRRKPKRSTRNPRKSSTSSLCLWKASNTLDDSNVPYSIFLEDGRGRPASHTLALRTSWRQSRSPTTSHIYPTRRFHRPFCMCIVSAMNGISLDTCTRSDD